MSDSFEKWLCDLPKAELHLHIDGSLTAKRLLATARKNGVALPYKNLDEVNTAYSFSDLQSFLDLYYMGASVLKDEEDFYNLMMDYLLVCRKENILHCEIMVEPQAYFPGGVSFSTMMLGFNRAISEAKSDWGQSVLLILSMLRHLSEAEAIQTLDLAEPYREYFCAIGLASAEKGNPPGKFSRLYAKAQERGYLAVAHAGEEGPPQYIRDALGILNVQRIDHGVRCIEDDSLVEVLASKKIPLTVCPLSNVRLCVFKTMQDHNILKLMDSGLLVTVNSDDPAYFGGYLNENYLALYRDLGLSKVQALQLARNSINASFLSEQEKVSYLQRINNYASRLS